MKKFEIDCFEVTESYDRDSKHVAFVSTVALAEKLVATQKGYRSYQAYKKTILIFETQEDIETYSRENLRKSGLAKLTSEERQALGL